MNAQVKYTQLKMLPKFSSWVNVVIDSVVVGLRLCLQPWVCVCVFEGESTLKCDPAAPFMSAVHTRCSG